MMIPITWEFRRKNTMPIVEVIAESSHKESEHIIIRHAIEIIQKADRFKGFLYPNKPSFHATKLVAVSFSIIFPSEKSLEKFLESIRFR